MLERRRSYGEPRDVRHLSQQDLAIDGRRHRRAVVERHTLPKAQLRLRSVVGDDQLSASHGSERPSSVDTRTAPRGR